MWVPQQFCCAAQMPRPLICGSRFPTRMPATLRYVGANAQIATAGFQARRPPPAAALGDGLGASRALGSNEASDRLRGSNARWLLPLELAGLRQAK